MSGPSRSLARGGLRGAAALLIASLALAPFPHTSPVGAATITVTTTSMTGPGCTLIDAMKAANTDAAVGGCAAGSGADAIVLQAGATYTLGAVGGSDPTEGDSGLPGITSPLTIQGNGAIIARSGAASFRIVQVGSGGNLTLDRVTIQNGQAPAGAGGGIAVTGGTLTLTNSTVRSNTALFGGGVYVAQGSSASVQSSRIEANGATQTTAGIYSNGALSVIDSSVSDNVATGGTGGINAGGNGQLTVIRSAVNQNTGRGTGGIAVGEATTTIANSTISGNTSTGPTFGVGGVIADGQPTMTLVNSTVVNNRSMATGGAGGVFRDSTIVLKNTIVAGNLRNGSTTDLRADCGFTGTQIISNGNNLVGSGTGCPTNGAGDLTVAPGNVFGGVLGPLQDNGGPTQSHALLPGSPALDAGDGATCTGTPINSLDQRSSVRPLGGGCDIGAFEGVGGAPRVATSVYAWGGNNGALGIDSPDAIIAAPRQVPNLTNVVALSGGLAHSLALKNDGTVWFWGQDRPNAPTVSAPTQVAGLSGVMAIAAGDRHSLAMKGDGTVWAWGANAKGQLGDGTTNDRPVPQQVSGLSGVTTIAAGSFHSLAVKTDGTVGAWGDNSLGQLGTGAITETGCQCLPSPVAVSGLTSVATVVGSRVHSAALKQDGTVRTWGFNFHGELGTGATTTDDGCSCSPTPVQASGLAGVTAIAAGGRHTLALKGDGAVWSWGENAFRQLGRSSAVCQVGGFLCDPSPGPVDGLGGVTGLAGGREHSLARKSDGTLWAFGSNLVGQVGIGAATPPTGCGCVPAPTQVSALTGVGPVAAGAFHSLAGTDALATPTPTATATSTRTPTATPTGTPVPPSADLSLTLQASTLQPSLDSDVTFTVGVANGGPNNATGVAVRVPLPGGLTYVSDTGGGSYGSGTGIWTVGALAAGANVSLAIVARFNATLVVAVTAQVSASGLPDPDSTPNNNNPAEDDQKTVQLTPIVDIVVNDASPAVNPNDGKCTLIEAIIAANTDAPSGNAMGECAGGNGPDTIGLQALNPPYVLTAVHNTAMVGGQAGGPNALPPITSDITILGGGATIERSSAAGTPAFRLFLIQPGGKLTLQNTTVRNGLAPIGAGGFWETTGGGLLTLGTLELVGVVVADNRAGCNGGGIAAYGPLTLRAGTIVRNNSTDCSGGGIFARETAPVLLTNATVRENSAPSGAGGGLMLFAPITAILTDSIVESNAARTDGGGLLAHGATAQVTLTNTQVRNNTITAGHGGGIANGRLLNGAMLVGGGTMVLANSIVSGNTATGGNGGGIVNLGQLTMTAGLIIYNTATSNGGGIAQVGPATTLTLEDTSVFSNRVTAGNGGGIANGGLGPTFPGGQVTLRNSRLFYNSVTGNVAHYRGGGGGIYNRGSLVELIATTVEGNTVNAPAAFMWTDGGGLLVDHSPGPIEVRATDSSFRLNRVLGPSAGGGGIFMGVYSTLLLTRTIVEQNEAPAGGGAVVGGAATLTDSTVRDNVATSSTGGGLQLRDFTINQALTITLDHTTVSGNRASGANGGGGGIDNHATLILRNGTVIENNEAAGQGNQGGGIFHLAGVLTVIDSIVRNNRAPNGTGGGIYNRRGRITLNRSTLSGNSSDRFVLLSIDNPASVTILASTISGNTSRVGTMGAAAGTSMTVANSTISGNTDQNATIVNNGTTAITNSTVAGNSTYDAINQNNTFTLANTIVAGNTRLGGGIANVDCASFVFPIISKGYNLVGQGTGCPSSGLGDRTVDPAVVFTTVLGPLGDYGGPTRTHRLLPGSPATDAGNPNPPGPGNPSACESIDQRGEPRPRDGDGIGGARCDIGAYERQTPLESPAATLTSLQPVSALMDGAGFALTATGTNFVAGSNLRWNGSPRTTVVQSPTQLTATILASDLATAEALSTALVTVLNPEASTSNALPFTISSSQVQTAQSVIVLPGASGTASSLPMIPGVAGVAATLTNNGAGSESATLSAATYTQNPTHGTLFAAGGFMDVQVAGADPTDTLTARFYYPSTVTGAAEASLLLNYRTGNTWGVVRGVGGLLPAKSTTDNLDGTISGGRFTVTFDNTSTPRLSQLSGTVFAMATEDTLPPTPAPTPIETPTPSPPATPSPTATPTPAPVGGQGFTLRGGPPVELSWRDGIQKTAYVLGRWSPLGGFTFRSIQSATPDPAQVLVTTPSGYTDVDAQPDQAYCYALLPVAGSPPSYDSVLGISDLLCRYPQSAGGISPASDFSIRLDEGRTATVSWTPSGLQAQYELLAVRLDGSVPRRVAIPGDTTGYADDTQGHSTCYQLVALLDSSEVGKTDIVCAVPGVATPPGGAASQGMAAAGERLSGPPR